MIVVGQTRFTGPQEWYNTDIPSSTSNFVKALMGVFNPYVKIQQGNYTLYEYNKPYPDESDKWKTIAIAGGAAAIVGWSALFFGLGRLSK